jgi:hypothetical protein
MCTSTLHILIHWLNVSLLYVLMVIICTFQSTVLQEVISGARMTAFSYLMSSTPNSK